MNLDFRRTLLNPAYDVKPSVLETQRIPLSFANPLGKRISEYEQVTLYNQPNPDWIPGGLGMGGWSTAFPGGRGTWENYFTEAKTVDWFAFRDPEGRWQRPYVAEKAREWHEFQKHISLSAKRRSYRDVDRDWVVEILGGHLGALGLHDYGLFMALASPIRDSLVDTLRNVIVNSSLDYLDNAQLIQASKLYLAQVLEYASPEIEPSKQLWKEHPAWSGARQYVEQLWGNNTYDHIEILFALHVIHEPLFGRLAREAFFSGAAALHGDVFTPQTIAASTRAAEAAQTWARALFVDLLAGDPSFGDYNRRLMAYWADKWLPLEIAAIDDFRQLWSATPTLRASDHARVLQRKLEHLTEDWEARYGALFEARFSVSQAVREAVSSAAGVPA